MLVAHDELCVGHGPTEDRVKRPRDACIETDLAFSRVHIDLSEALLDTLSGTNEPTELPVPAEGSDSTV